MFVDSHAHLQSEMYSNDASIDIINRLASDLIDVVICVGCNIPSSQQAIDLAHKYDRVFATVGIHPCDTSEYSASVLPQITTLAKDSRVVAIGEIGLDYHYSDTNKSLQIESFCRQYDIAMSLHKPYIVHMRDAFDDFCSMQDLTPKYGAVMHCFGGDVSQARYCLDSGYHISFSGNITYKNAQTIRDAAEFVPLDRLLIETDCPYLAPVPHRGKPNEPSYVSFVASHIAHVKGISIDEVARATKYNALGLFGIKL